MTNRTRVGIVGAGYLFAVIAAAAAGHAYDMRMARMPYDTSGGMFAAGQTLAVVATFLAVAIVPTLLALWFLRRHHGLWLTFAAGAVAFAAIGLLAVLMPVVLQPPYGHPALVALDLLSLAQLLGVPGWTLAFVLMAVIAPTPPSRRLFIAAIAIELVIAGCAALHWFVPSSPL